MSEIIRQFINHAKMTHRQEFPHENPVNMSNPSEQAERYFWLIGFLNHCAETFSANKKAVPQSIKGMKEGKKLNNQARAA